LKFLAFRCHFKFSKFTLNKILYKFPSFWKFFKLLPKQWNSPQNIRIPSKHYIPLKHFCIQTHSYICQNALVSNNVFFLPSSIWHQLVLDLGVFMVWIQTKTKPNFSFSLVFEPSYLNQFRYGFKLGWIQFKSGLSQNPDSLPKPVLKQFFIQPGL